MAKKNVMSFKADPKTKKITLYTNIEQTEAEKTVIETYLKMGYTPKFEEKKAGITVADMRKELAGDKETLKAFNEAYGKKGDKKAYFNACKIYTNWKKEQKANAKAEAEAEETK